jgi:hypothetical protein
MANILVNIEKGIEVGASDLLKWINKGETALKAGPEVLAALGTLLSAVATVATDTSAAASASGLNIALDEADWVAIKAVWTDIVTTFAAAGVKI